MTDFLLRGEFLQYTLKVQKELDTHFAEIDKLRNRFHELANLISSLQYTKELLESVMEDMKNVPRKEDLLNLKSHIDDQLLSLEKSRTKEDAAAGRRFGWYLTIFGFFLTVVVIVVNVLTKK